MPIPLRTVLEGRDSSQSILFLAGRGGDPKRHLPFLERLQRQGFTVIAPHFAMIPPVPSRDDLTERIARTRVVVEDSSVSTSIVGIGHSIGATILMALAGATLWTIDGQSLNAPRLTQLRRLVALAPAIDFVKAPGALDGFSLPFQLWVGGIDRIAPVPKLDLLEQKLASRVPFETHIVDDADHFAFMNEPPPGVPSTLEDPKTFFDHLAAEVTRFARTKAMGYGGP